MTLQFFCPRWGSEVIPWEAFLLKIKEAGYDGVEWAIGSNTSFAELDLVFNLCVQLNIPVIAQHYETSDADFHLHYEKYEKWFRKIKGYPVFRVNSQTGKDYFPITDNQQLIMLAGEYAGKMGVQVSHETHRGKFSFAAHVTRAYLAAIPDLRLTLDASHWVNVAESLLEDQQDTMAEAIARTDHIHARIGFAEGPQVHDPRADLFDNAKAAHLAWWDEVVRIKKAANGILSITPEFGPWPYMVHHPVSREPLASQWEINLFMLKLLKQRYATQPFTQTCCLNE